MLAIATLFSICACIEDMDDGTEESGETIEYGTVNDNKSYDETEADYSGENAVDITVMNYNVGGYGWGLNKGMDIDKVPEKEANFKQFLNDQACDLIAIEEQYEYLDTGATISSDGLYDALYPFNYFPTVGWSAFYSKVKLNNTVEYTFAASGRRYITADIAYKGKDIHIVCVHLHPTSSTLREAEMDELIAHLSQKDRFIVFGDFNTASVTEYERLTAAGLKFVNGGYMDYKNTYNPYSEEYYPGYYDNIAYSDGIVLKSIKIPDVYDNLASDHLPVVCTFTVM